MRVYVIMKKAVSPIAITPRCAHEVVSDVTAARKRVKALSEKARRNVYWYESVKMVLQQ